jgi:GT2 family glycosyltransferase
VTNSPCVETRDDVGVVVIGRNEGERLRRCIGSAAGPSRTLVYVDSGSTDDSVATAAALGAEVVALDMSEPFTVARARNAGLERLAEVDPEVRFVQFVDGDCELVAGWLSRARGVFEDRDDVAIVCGRLRERSPDRSLYHRLADLESAAPLVGETATCGGLAMMNVERLRRAGGFREDLIAGEEGELCLRLRRRGGRIIRLGDAMALQDMDLSRFSQWWLRAVRSGLAHAEGFALHGRGPEQYGLQETRSLTLWGLSLPLAAVLLAYPTQGLSLALLAAYPLLALRIASGLIRRGWSWSDAGWYAAFCVLGKFAQAFGMLQFRFRRARAGRSPLIESKDAPRPPHARRGNPDSLTVTYSRRGLVEARAR